MESAVVTDIYVNQEIARVKKINDKLLYLLNKYRLAYLKSLELILFYEKILKKNYEKNEGLDLCNSFKKKRQSNPHVLEEEQFLRKRFKTDMFCGASVAILPYKGESTKDNIVESSNFIKKEGLVAYNLESEQNKADYVNLDTLDFSAYAEDSEGCIKYCEKENEVEKGKINTQNKTIKKSDPLKSVYNSLNHQKKAPPITQSKYGNPMLKSTYSKTFSSTYKGTQNEKQTKGPNIPLNPNMINKSTYQRSLSKHPEIDKKGVMKNSQIDRSDINKSVYVPNITNKQVPNTNRSVYIGHKSISNKISNLGDSVYTGSKFMPNKYNTNILDKSAPSTVNKNQIKQKMNENVNVKKGNSLNKPTNMQNSVYIKNPKLTNTSNQSIYMSKQMLNRNTGTEKVSTLNLNLKSKGITNDTKNDSAGKKLNTEYNSVNILGKNNVYISSQEKNILKKNKENEARNQLLEELKVKIEEQDDDMEKPNEEHNGTRDFRGNVQDAFLPLTMSYIDALIENEEKNKVEERGKRDIEYIMVLKNEDKKKEETNKTPKKSAFALHDLTEEEYQWIVEYREKGIKPNLGMKKEENIEGQLNKIDNGYKDRKEEVKTSGNEMQKEMQKNEFRFLPEGEVVRNFRIGGTSGFGKLRCPISENSYKMDAVKTENTINFSTSKDNLNIQTTEHKETNENLENASRYSEQKKEYVSELLNIDIKQKEHLNDFRSAIRNINQEIIQKKNQENICENAKEEIVNEVTSGVKENELLNTRMNSFVARNMKQQSFKTVPFPPSLKNNALPKTEKDTTKHIQNNRANLYIELNVNYEFMSLDIIDIDKIINEGLLTYKNAKESFIECSTDIKDMVIYEEIMKKEKKTFYFNIEQAGEVLKGATQKKIEVFFKSGDEIKREILKIMGVSIFQNINVTLHPTKSLINDKKLVLWFTKKKKEKGSINMNITESDSSQSTLFKKVNKRFSTMGTFCQPLIIMLSSLKRQSSHTTLKKIIYSLILCSCDSSSLEKIVHTLPEENSKNYSQWKDSLHNLDMLLGDRKSIILKKLVEFHVENSDDESIDNEMDLTNKKKRSGYINESFNEFGIHNKNDLDMYHLNNYDFMKGRNNMDNCLSNSLSSSTTATTSTTTSTTYYNTSNDSGDSTDITKENVNIYEDEEFCLFIGTIPNAHKRFQYLLLVDNFNFIYEDLMTHIKNKLSSIDLIVNKHIQLKQLFCNVLFLCNWLNEPKHYKWFLWNDIFKKIEKLCGYQENGKISRERNIMLLLAEHTGLIFNDKELNNLKKISKFHIKDLYDKSIDFINSYFELKNQMDTTELKKKCCISIDGVNILPNDKFLEKIGSFVQNNYEKMLYIIWNLDLLMKKYVILIVWLGDIKPFYPLFSYIDVKKKITYSHDMFVNLVLFFESYNKYVNIIKKKNEDAFPMRKGVLENEQQAINDQYSFSINPYSNIEENAEVNISNEREEIGTSPSFSIPTISLEQNKWNTSNEAYNHNTLSYKMKNQQNSKNQLGSLSTRKRESSSQKRNSKLISYKKYGEYDSLEKNDETITTFPQLKKRKSLTNTVNYACEIKRKSLEMEQINLMRRKSSSSGISVEFEL